MKEIIITDTTQEIFNLIKEQIRRQDQVIKIFRGFRLENEAFYFEFKSGSKPVYVTKDSRNIIVKIKENKKSFRYLYISSLETLRALGEFSLQGVKTQNVRTWIEKGYLIAAVSENFKFHQRK